MHTYRRRIILVYYSLLFIFFLVFIFAYVQLKRQIAVFDIGLSYYVEDMIVIVMSFLSIVKVVYEIYDVEHHHEFERRIKKFIRKL